MTSTAWRRLQQFEDALEVSDEDGPLIQITYRDEDSGRVVVFKIPRTSGPQRTSLIEELNAGRKRLAQWEEANKRPDGPQAE